MTGLKPCPFCGSRKIEINRIDGTREYYLTCEECGIEQPLYPTADEAVGAWNRRADCD